MNAMSAATTTGAEAEAPAREICILMNTASGKRGENGDADRVRRYCEASGGRAELRSFDSGKEIAETCRRAMADGYGTIVAAGGDGTVSAVAECLADTGCNLGILPLGTFNYFARSVGIPEEVEDALAVLSDGVAQPLTVAEVNGRLFLNNASIGIYPHILREREDTYRRWGRSRIAAYWSVIRTVAGFRGARRFQVVVDGREERVKTPLVFVAICAYQLDEFGLEGADIVRGGELAVFVAPDCGRLGLLRFAALLLLRGMRRGKDFELFHGREVEIVPSVEPKRPRLIARDGEKEKMPPPFLFRVRTGALSVIAPRDAERPGG